MEISAQFPRDNETTADADLLMDFADALFYNFKTNEAAQKAIEYIAEPLSIIRVTVCKTVKARTMPVQTLYTGEDIKDEMPHIEEKSLHSISGSTYGYRIYRRSSAAPLSMIQRRMLEFVFKTLHTYLNRQSSLEMAKYARTHDVALGCFNAVGLRDTLREKQERGLDFTQYAVMFINVRKFKSINARYGFDNGNQVMQMIVSQLRQLLDGEECFAHFGGDNFTVFLRRVSMQDKIDAMNSMVCSVYFEGRQHEVPISFRMGIYRIQPETIQVSEILEKASVAFSFARQNDKEGIVYYNTEKRRNYEFQKMLESMMQPALQQGEFLVYFQPKVDVRTFEINGAEALSRWMHDGKLIAPDTFIPVFERSGMIAEIDFYVFEHVCSSLHAWISQGITPVVVSVNFSKITLETPDFAAHLREITERCHVSPQYLEVEFTETFCMENEDKFKDILAELKAAGFCTSLDDFGKGYSSLNMLKNLDFDILKLDRGFLSIGTSAKDRDWIILQSTISMAQSLHMQVVAEGVEDAAQINMLRNLGCSKAQGYYFDKPLPETEFLERLKAGRYEK